MNPPSLHGREGPLAALGAALEAARQGRGQMVLVSGEPGIGKSALVTAFAAQAESQGVGVTWGRAWEFADAPPYFPVWPCLRALGLAAPGSVANDGGTSMGEGEHAFALWESVLAALASSSSRGPQLWILEDLHAADLGTWDLLTFLVQPLRATKALIVGTARAQDPQLTERKLRRLSRIGRDGLEIRLEPLGAGDVAALAAETTGRALSTPAAGRLAALTAGNPLFVVEYARASGRSGGMEAALASLPRTVRQVVLDRVALLPDAARDALASGAVLGREFAAATIARMHDSDPLLVLDNLLPAVRAGIVRELGAGQLAFSHALLSDAIYDAISQAERVRLHHRAELALAALGESVPLLVERARHAVAAAPAGPPESTLATARRACELLEREGAFDRALALHLRLSEARAAGFLPPASAVENLHVAHIAREAGRADVARRLCEQVVASARQNGDAATFARAALAHAAAVRVAVIDRHQIALLEEALRLLGDQAPALSCRVLARLSTALQPADNPEVPLEMAHRALRQARAIGDDAAVLDVLELAGLGAYYAKTEDRIAWAEELRDRAGQAGDVGKALTAWTWLSYWHIEAGDYPAFDRAANSALELSLTAGHPRSRWGPLLLASGRALALGRFEASDRYLTEVTQIAALIDDPALALSLVTHEILRARLQRDAASLERALAKLDGVIEGVKRKEEFAAEVRAACHAHLGEVEATRAALAQIDIESATSEPDPMPRALVGEAVALVGSDEQRRRARERLLEFESADIFGSGVTYTYEGSVERVLGLLDAALGDLPSAEVRLRKALARARQRGHLSWVAIGAGELAAVLFRARNPAEARALSEESATLGQELGWPQAHLGAGIEGGSSPQGARTGAPTDGAGEPDLRMELTGDVWTVVQGGRTARVKDSRGLQLLARLVQRPGEEVHVLALASDQGASAPESSAGEMIDDQARAAYRERLEQIVDSLAAAEAAGDAAAARRFEAEREALTRELSRALGLGGRTRQAGSASERARINVQRRLKAAIERVAEVEAGLGQFLERAVRTGTYCCFRP